MHTLLQELNSLNELHVPDHTEFGFSSVKNFVRNAANSAKAALLGERRDTARGRKAHACAPQAPCASPRQPRGSLRPSLAYPRLSWPSLAFPRPPLPSGPFLLSACAFACCPAAIRVYACALGVNVQAVYKRAHSVLTTHISLPHFLPTSSSLLPPPSSSSLLPPPSSLLPHSSLTPPTPPSLLPHSLPLFLTL